MRRAIMLGLVAACGGGKASPAPVAPVEAPDVPALTMTRHGLGPISDKTRATLTAVREAMAPVGISVTPVFEHSLELDGYDGKEKMFFVVPNDDGTIQYVHATSRRIAIEGHPAWRIGATFHDAASLGHCDCWGDWPVCYRGGEHVAAGFTVSCEGLDSAKGRRALDGAVLTRVIWSPTVFATREVPSFLPRSD